MAAPPSRKLMVLSLVVAAIGIPIQIAGGAPYPAVPPGLIILIVAAAAVAFLPRRWAPAIGLAVAAFMLVGFFGPYLDQTTDRLTDPSHVAVWIGTWLQMLAILATAGAGIGWVLGLISRRTA